MLITDKQVDQCRKYIPEIDAIVLADDLSQLENLLNDAMIQNMDKNDNLTLEGRRIERLYDNIYWQNKYPEDFPVELEI